MFKTVLEYLSSPVVASVLFLVDDMHQNFQFWLVCVVFEGFDDLRFWDVLVLDAQSSLDASVHLLAHEIELLDHRNQLDQLFLQKGFLLLYQKFS